MGERSVRASPLRTLLYVAGTGSYPGWPAAGDRLHPGIEANAFRAVHVVVAEDRCLPSAEGVKGHRHRYRDVDSDHPHLDLTGEFPRSIAVRNASSSATCCSRIPIRTSKGRTAWPSERTVGSIARSTTRRTFRCYTGGGEVVDRLILDGPQPANCAFALEGRKLRVTEAGKGQVEEIDMACDGLPLHLPKFA